MSDFEIAAYDRNHCLLCRQDGNVVGQVNVRDLRQESFGGYVIWNLLVFPKHRNIGAARTLVQCVLDNFNDAPVYITAEPFFDSDAMDESELLNWYQRLGFVDWQHEPELTSRSSSKGKWMIWEPPKENEPAEKQMSQQARSQ